MADDDDADDDDGTYCRCLVAIRKWGLVGGLDMDCWVYALRGAGGRKMIATCSHYTCSCDVASAFQLLANANAIASIWNGFANKRFVVTTAAKTAHKV